MRPFDRVSLAVTVAAVLAAAGQAVLAQSRPGQPAVLEPPPMQSRPPAPDIAAEFRARYAASGAPRLLLFWNAELSDRARADVVVQDRVTASGSAKLNTLRQATAGDAGTSALTESTGETQSQRQRELAVGERQDAKRTTVLSARNAAQFERAFDAEMRQGGARLIDHAMAVRSLSTEKERAGDNQKLLEAEALRAKADLLLQVLFVADDAAPIAYGFDVTVRDVTTGAVLASFYTAAAPPVRPVRTAYVAGDHGFQLQSAPNRPPTLEDVAVALAREVMNQLGPVLPARADSSRTRR